MFVNLFSRLKWTFEQIDYDESGEIEISEFMEFLDERRSPFTDHIFVLFDDDNSGEIDFNEFIVSASEVCA